MATPEGRVKDAVKTLLAQHGILPAGSAARQVDHEGWYYMPVPGGFGVAGIPDFVGHFRGRFFAVETKAAGKKPSALQELQIQAISATGGKAFVVAGKEGMAELGGWLNLVRSTAAERFW